MTEDKQWCDGVIGGYVTPAVGRFAEADHVCIAALVIMAVLVVVVVSCGDAVVVLKMFEVHRLPGLTQGERLAESDMKIENRQFR